MVSLSVDVSGLIAGLCLGGRDGEIVPNVETEVVSNWGTKVSDGVIKEGLSESLLSKEISTYSRVSPSCKISSSSRSSLERGRPVSESQVTSLIICCVSTGKDGRIASPYCLCKYAPRLAILSFASCSYFLGYNMAYEERVQLRSTFMKWESVRSKMS